MIRWRVVTVLVQFYMGDLSGPIQSASELIGSTQAPPPGHHQATRPGSAAPDDIAIVRAGPRDELLEGLQNQA